jgi:hypothetical protein
LAQYAHGKLQKAAIIYLEEHKIVYWPLNDNELGPEEHRQVVDLHEDRPWICRGNQDPANSTVNSNTDSNTTGRSKVSSSLPNIIQTIIINI